MLKRTTVSSSRMSHRPRVTRKGERSAGDLPRIFWRYTDVPAKNTNTGAQKCVIQRVKNSGTDVRVRSVGSNLNCEA